MRLNFRLNLDVLFYTCKLLPQEPTYPGINVIRVTIEYQTTIYFSGLLKRIHCTVFYSMRRSRALTNQHQMSGKRFQFHGRLCRRV